VNLRFAYFPFRYFVIPITSTSANTPPPISNKSVVLNVIPPMETVPSIDEDAAAAAGVPPFTDTFGFNAFPPPAFTDVGVGVAGAAGGVSVLTDCVGVTTVELGALDASALYIPLPKITPVLNGAAPVHSGSMGVPNIAALFALVAQ
jgi:hypothetical protein